MSDRCRGATREHIALLGYIVQHHLRVDPTCFDKDSAILGLIVSTLARAVATPSTEDVISQTVVEIWRNITAATPEHNWPVYYQLIVSRLFGPLKADDDGNRQPKLNIQGRRGLFLVIAHFTRALVESITSRPVEEATRPSLLDLHVARIFQLLKESRTSVELELSVSAAVEHLAAGHAPSPPSLTLLANTCLSVINGTHTLKGAKLEMGRPLAFAATVCLGHSAKWVSLRIVTTREVLDSLDRTNLALYELTRSNPRLRQAIAFARQAWTLAAAVDHQGAATMHQHRFTESPRRSKSYEMGFSRKGNEQALQKSLASPLRPHTTSMYSSYSVSHLPPDEDLGEKTSAADNAGEEVLIIDDSTNNVEESEGEVTGNEP
ncbi:hypothetical protein FOZ63_027722, partial [Perkinsus olseni]